MIQHIRGGITMMINADRTTIELHDKEAGITFAKIELSPDDLSRLLSREYRVEASIEVRGAENVGKKLEHSAIEIPLWDDFQREYGNARNHQDNAIREQARVWLNTYKKDEGWVPNVEDFKMGAFFVRKGRQWVRLSIIRWVNKNL